MADSPIYDEWVDEWTIHLRSRLASGSVPVYLRALRQFSEWLPADVTTLAQITRHHVEGWMADLADRDLKTSTRDVRLKALTQFFNYACDEENLPNPTAKVARVKVQDPIIEIPSDDDIRSLLATCTGADPIDRRDNFLIRLLADAGLRRFEAVAINLDELNLAEREALVHGKGGKDRTVAFGDTTAAAGMKWLRTRRQWADTDQPAVFVTRTGTRLAATSIPKILERRCAAAGIPAIHPHALRHRATHSLLNAGLGEQVVESQMGWTGGQMVRRYGRALADQRARGAIKQARTGDL